MPAESPHRIWLEHRGGTFLFRLKALNARWAVSSHSARWSESRVMRRGRAWSGPTRPGAVRPGTASLGQVKVWPGLARLGEARLWPGSPGVDVAGQGAARLPYGPSRLGRVRSRMGRVWLGKVRLGPARRGETWQDLAGTGQARQGPERLGRAPLCPVRRGAARRGQTRLTLVAAGLGGAVAWHGFPWAGMAGSGRACHGWARPGAARPGEARLPSGLAVAWSRPGAARLGDRRDEAPLRRDLASPGLARRVRRGASGRGLVWLPDTAPLSIQPAFLGGHNPKGAA